MELLLQLLVLLVRVEFHYLVCEYAVSLLIDTKVSFQLCARIRVNRYIQKGQITENVIIILFLYLIEN